LAAQFTAPEVLLKTTNIGSPKKQWSSTQILQQRVSGRPHLLMRL